MKRSHTLLLFAIVSIIANCASQTATDSVTHYVGKKYDKNGVLTSEWQYKIDSGDTIYDGFYKWYYEGKLVVLTSYKDAVREGFEIHYYYNGNVEKKMNYFSGLTVGPIYQYRHNGIIESYTHLYQFVDLSSANLEK